MLAFECNFFLCVCVCSLRRKWTDAALTDNSLLHWTSIVIDWLIVGLIVRHRQIVVDYSCVFHCLWLTTESLDFFTPSFSWVLERDPFIETETGFGSSFSEAVRSICKTDTSLSYPLKPLSILLSPCSFTGECLKITSKLASKIVNDGRDYFLDDDVGNVCMNLAHMKCFYYCVWFEQPSGASPGQNMWGGQTCRARAYNGGSGGGAPSGVRQSPWPGREVGKF